MTTPTAPAPDLPAVDPSAAGMCLLHGDFHPMDPACWSAITDWFFDHQHIPETEQRHAYAAEVERGMLDALVAELRLPNLSRGLPCRRP